MKNKIILLILVLSSLTLRAEKRPPYADGIEAGIKNFETRNYVAAENDFVGVLKKYPKNAVAAYNLGLAQYRQKKFENAIESFEVAEQSPKSFYSRPAKYYKAVALLNLDQRGEALRIAKNYEQKDFIKERMTELVSAIESGTDQSMENARAAEKEGNYELCLLEMEESILSDTRKGKELSTLCINELYGRRPVERGDTYYKLYLDSQITQTDNLYQMNDNILGKSVYNIDVGGEYLWRAPIDYGLGLNYNYFNGIDVPNLKREIYTASIPLYVQNRGYSFGFKPYYEHNKVTDNNFYSASGVEFHTTASERRDFVVGVTGKAEKRSHMNPEYELRSGDFGYLRLFWTEYFGDFSFNANVAAESTATGDQPLGPFLVPAANKAMIYGLGLSYDITEEFQANIRGLYTERDYTHVVSPLGTDRKDFNRRLSGALFYRFNRNFRTFLQYTQGENVSNYDNNEILNRNYKENISSFGISLLLF
ncbi:MAG: hypothetical protein K0R29_2801 [Pseudobdellovibrio sp.]|jgi:tetratricopeptide (TPR) repeat protein|nr:hypothetical protein [Pseudobdellovibrio sp.]